MPMQPHGGAATQQVYEQECFGAAGSWRHANSHALLQHDGPIWQA